MARSKPINHNITPQHASTYPRIVHVDLAPLTNYKHKNHNNNKNINWHVYSNQKNVKSAVSVLHSTSSSFGTAAASTRFDAHANGIDDATKALALAEEEAAMNQYRVSEKKTSSDHVDNAVNITPRIELGMQLIFQTKVGSPTGGAAAATNPFLPSPVSSQANIVDLFGGGGPMNAGANQLGDAAGQANTKASDDLLQLGNPFADMFGGAAPALPVVGGQVAAGATSSSNGGGALWSMGNGKLDEYFCLNLSGIRPQ